jgi:hypothetical protein
VADHVVRLAVEALVRALCRDDLAADAASDTWNRGPAASCEEVERVVVYGNKMHIALKSAKETAENDAVQPILKIQLPDARPRARKNAGSGPRRID